MLNTIIYHIFNTFFIPKGSFSWHKCSFVIPAKTTTDVLINTIIVIRLWSLIIKSAFCSAQLNTMEIYVVFNCVKVWLCICLCLKIDFKAPRRHYFLFLSFSDPVWINWAQRGQTEHVWRRAFMFHFWTHNLTLRLRIFINLIHS